MSDREQPRTPGPDAAAEPALLSAVQLSKFFSARGSFGKKSLVRAVENASLRIGAGETLGVVGESGSGKTTLGRLLVRLLEPSAGRVYFEGRDISYDSDRDLRSLRRSLQILFQDAVGSLDEELSIEDIIAEPLRIHRLAAAPADERRRVAELMQRVGLPAALLGRRPRELSIGQCQRVAVARVLALEPRFVVCDEPVSSLDVVEQQSLLELLVELQLAEGCAYLFISHDVRLVLQVSRRVLVMYAGRVVESVDTETLRREASLHPYTRALMHAVPEIDPARRRLRVILEGEPPSPFRPGVGCAFHPRCPRAKPGQCDREAPPLEKAFGATEHEVACWFPLHG